MSEDSFDKEISQLYQQRKRDIVAPEIDISIIPKLDKRQYSVSNVLALLFLGSTASFSIFAIINHLVNTPKIQPATYTTNQVVELEYVPIEAVDKAESQVHKILPPKPNAVDTDITKSLVATLPTKPSKIASLELNLAPSRLVVMPKIRQQNQLVKPIYQVMPKYSAKALQANETGEIRLRYQINALGKVENIEVISSNVDRTLKRAAVKALSQWQYEIGNQNQKDYEIIFDFNVHR